MYVESRYLTHGPIVGHRGRTYLNFGFSIIHLVYEIKPVTPRNLLGLAGVLLFDRCESRVELALRWLLDHGYIVRREGGPVTRWASLLWHLSTFRFPHR